MRRHVAAALRMLTAGVLVLTLTPHAWGSFGIIKTRVTLPRLRPPDSPILVERVALEVTSDSPDVSTTYADRIRTRLAESFGAWKLYRVVDGREAPEALVRVSLRGLEADVRTEIEMEQKYVNVGERQEWDAKKKKMVTKDVMAYRREPVTVHVVDGRMQGIVQVEGTGVNRRQDVSATVSERNKDLSNIPEVLRTPSGVRTYLTGQLAEEAVAAVTFGVDPLEALLATDGELKPGNKFAEVGLFKEALDEWNKRPLKGDKEAARLHNVGVATEALAYALPPFTPEHVAQLEQAKDLYKRAFLLDNGEKYFAEPLKRIETSLQYAQQASAMKAEMDRARKTKTAAR